MADAEFRNSRWVMESVTRVRLVLCLLCSAALREGRSSVGGDRGCALIGWGVEEEVEVDADEEEEEEEEVEEVEEEEDTAVRAEEEVELVELHLSDDDITTTFLSRFLGGPRSLQCFKHALLALINALQKVSILIFCFTKTQYICSITFCTFSAK